MPDKPVQRHDRPFQAKDQPWINPTFAYCPCCGKEYPADTKVCPVCGRQLVLKTVRVPLMEK